MFPEHTSIPVSVPAPTAEVPSAEATVVATAAVVSVAAATVAAAEAAEAVAAVTNDLPITYQSVKYNSERFDKLQTIKSLTTSRTHVEVISDFSFTGLFTCYAICSLSSQKESTLSKLYSDSMN